MEPTTAPPTKKERAAAKRQELVSWLAANSGRQKWMIRREAIPQHLQGVINAMVDAGELIRYYKTGRSFTGNYKRCYIQLPPKKKPAV